MDPGYKYVKRMPGTAAFMYYQGLVPRVHGRWRALFPWVPPKRVNPPMEDALEHACCRAAGGKDLARLSCEARAPSLRTRARPRVQGEGIHVDLVYGNCAGWGVGGSVTKRKVYRYTCGSHGRECMKSV